jgi:hypothetical protein
MAADGGRAGLALLGRAGAGAGAPAPVTPGRCGPADPPWSGALELTRDATGLHGWARARGGPQRFRGQRQEAVLWRAGRTGGAGALPEPPVRTPVGALGPLQRDHDAAGAAVVAMLVEIDALGGGVGGDGGGQVKGCGPGPGPCAYLQRATAPPCVCAAPATCPARGAPWRSAPAGAGAARWRRGANDGACGARSATRAPQRRAPLASKLLRRPSPPPSATPP